MTISSRAKRYRVPLAMLTWAVGASGAHAQTAANNPPAAADESIWSNVTFGATFGGYCNRLSGAES